MSRFLVLKQYQSVMRTDFFVKFLMFFSIRIASLMGFVLALGYG